MSQHEALALVVKTKNSPDRYFSSFGKNRRIMTAWSLAGAELFLFPQEALGVQNELIAKGKNCHLVTIGLTAKKSVETIQSCLDNPYD